MQKIQNQSSIDDFAILFFLKLKGSIGNNTLQHYKMKGKSSLFIFLQSVFLFQFFKNLVRSDKILLSLMILWEHIQGIIHH